MARLAPTDGVQRSPVTVEEEYFPPPPELRELLRGLEAALTLLNGAPFDGTSAAPGNGDGRPGPGRRPDHGGGRRAGALAG